MPQLQGPAVAAFRGPASEVQVPQVPRSRTILIANSTEPDLPQTPTSSVGKASLAINGTAESPHFLSWFSKTLHKMASAKSQATTVFVADVHK